jgi:hypothetical protein
VNVCVSVIIFAQKVREKPHVLMLRRSGNLKTYNPWDTEMIKVKTDANEASIYAKAYDKSIQSKSLYGFLKSRGTFEKTFDG